LRTKTRADHLNRSYSTQAALGTAQAVWLRPAPPSGQLYLYTYIYIHTYIYVYSYITCPFMYFGRVGGRPGSLALPPSRAPLPRVNPPIEGAFYHKSHPWPPLLFAGCAGGRPSSLAPSHPPPIRFVWRRCPGVNPTIESAFYQKSHPWPPLSYAGCAGAAQAAPRVGLTL